MSQIRFQDNLERKIAICLRNYILGESMICLGNKERMGNDKMTRCKIKAVIGASIHNN